MENWQAVISDEIKSTINLDAFAKNYLAKIKNNQKNGEPEHFAIRHASADLRKLLEEYKIKTAEIVHLLHFCGMAIYPRMYNKCGCHEQPQELQYATDY